MKKLALIAILAFVGFNSAMAQKTAKMQFKSETIDYGEIKKGGKQLLEDHLSYAHLNQ